MKNKIIPLQQQFMTMEAGKSLDYYAICCFAATGFFLDNDTYYTNKKVLRPASEYVDGIEKKYFDWYYAPRDISFSQAVDEFAHLFEQITKEQTQGKRVILPLSGGLDSRSQAAALKGYANVNTYSYEFAHSFNETKYGAEIARRMAWDFKKYIVPEGYLWNKIDELAEINGCYAEFTAARQMSIADDYPAMGDIFYLGHWGDVLFDDMGVADDLPFDRQLEVLYKKIIKKGGLELAQALWTHWGLNGCFEDYFRERLSHLLAAIRIDNANSRIRVFKSLYWAPRWTSINLSVFAKYHPLALPYYDNRLCEFICTIPERYLSGRQIQIEYIKRKAPELAAIPWQSYDPCSLYNYKNYSALSNQAVVFGRKLMRRGKEVLTGKVCTERNWEIQFLGTENDRQLQKNLFAEGGLAPKEISQAFYNKFVNGNHRQKIWYAHPLSLLLTLNKQCV